MPVADFPGAPQLGLRRRAALTRPTPTYGTPDDLKALVDRAHGLGLMVLLDVVYNHFGPDGNYLHGYCPEFFNPRHQTPWGAAINFDGEQARGGARVLRRTTRCTGSRNTVSTACVSMPCTRSPTTPPRHIVLEIADALRDGPGQERHVHLVLENERNQAQPAAPRAAASRRTAQTAQWNDDLHHAAHVLLTGEADSYYADYAEDAGRLFAAALAEGFVYQGEASAVSRRAPRTASRAAGLRIDRLRVVPAEPRPDRQPRLRRADRPARRRAGRLEAAYACLLLSPHVPMLFMGEEFASASPFLYFCDFDGELARAP